MSSLSLPAPFTINVPDAALRDLADRLARTRFPERTAAPWRAGWAVFRSAIATAADRPGTGCSPAGCAGPPNGLIPVPHRDPRELSAAGLATQAPRDREQTEGGKTAANAARRSSPPLPTGPPPTGRSAFRVTVAVGRPHQRYMP
jgi:hypothetical protein